jgi:predicted ferric reductase
MEEELKFFHRAVILMYALYITHILLVRVTEVLGWVMSSWIRALVRITLRRSRVFARIFRSDFNNFRLVAATGSL